MPAPNDADLQAVAGVLARQLGDSGRRLATAESCTGGWIAKVCTDLPGSSAWFLGGLVAYGDTAKIDLLNVPQEVLSQFGAVSESVVHAMASGALQHFGADLAVAVSGIAGPDGGTEAKPVGTVWFAWARRRSGDAPDVTTRCERLPGDRESVRRWTVELALRGLLDP
jgi:nicotinamide-nucleotide amidase